MAGTVTVTEARHDPNITVITWDWLSDASGDADQATTYQVFGRLLFAVFDPDAAGTQPTDLYDVVINTEDGYDILAGNGANLSNAADVAVTDADGLGSVGYSTLDLVVSNAGNAKGGKVQIVLAR